MLNIAMAGYSKIISATVNINPLSQPHPLALRTRNSHSRLFRRQCKMHRSDSICTGTTTDYTDDDIHSLLQILPHDVRDKLLCDSKRAQLLEVTLDLGRPPQACYYGDSGRRDIRKTEVLMEELEYAQNAIGEFGGDNRAGIAGTLHRISAIRNKNGDVIGLTCRVGRAFGEQIDMVRDLLEYGKSILFLGRPGVGKTTVMRAISRALSDELLKRVVIVDTSNEIGGDGDIPHPAIGSARRLQVPGPSTQHHVMIEAVENHMPEVIIVDEISTKAEVRACRTIAQRGVMLIGSAHGKRLQNIMKNPALSDLIGGLEAVIVSDKEARIRNSKKSILERKAAPTFPFLIEMRERDYWVAHRTDRSVDELLNGKKPLVEVRRRDKQFKVVIERTSLVFGSSSPNLNGFETVTKHPVCSVPTKIGRGRISSVTGIATGSCNRRLFFKSKIIMASTTTTETEKLGVKIVKNPPESKLSDLGVRSWPKWGCPPSKFPWIYSSKETCYLLEGKVKVYPDGSDEAVEIGAGDLVVFPKGMSCTWDVSEAVDKHYKFE
ncbi:hypothetical protein ACJIZ3_003141 [Penstemon smallii]|uniref:AAA+ ATPase domain-containing protein n=1 Tax=Penstemon smallii TaxID=265156 RepID=A0ABD3UB02_9LAMI